MKRPSNYNTKQRASIMSYIASMGDKHFTAAEILEHFGSAVGRATIYRLLDRMEENGQLRKYTVDNASGACYQLAENVDCEKHLHLKCGDCGTLIHLECSAIDYLKRHFLSAHNFQIDAMKSVLYGKCENCRNISGGI